MKRILIPCDFSQVAQHAYTFALDIAKREDSQVFVLFAIDYPIMYEASYRTSPYFFDPKVSEVLEEEAKKKFQEMKRSHARQEDISLSVEQGPVNTVIQDFIVKHNIDLVVMGTHGTNSLVESLIGSNTEKVVRRSPVPVFAVRKAVNLSSIQNIVLPTTLQWDQTKFINAVKDLQAFFKARLHLLLINTPHNMMRTKDEKGQMEDFVKNYKLEDCTINIRDDFSEQDAIMNFTREVKADVIAMATHGRRGLSHLFLGSVTEDVVNHVECPIWTFNIRK